MGGILYTTGAVTLNGVSYGGSACMLGGGGGGGQGILASGIALTAPSGASGPAGTAGVAGTTAGPDLYLASSGQALTVLTGALAGEQQGIYDAQALQAAGGTPAYTWALASGSLPPGMSLDPDSGQISGIPTQAGAYLFTVAVTDQGAPRATVTVPLSLYVAVPVGSLGGPVAAVTGSSNGGSSTPGGTAAAGGSGTATPSTQATVSGGQGSVAVAEYNADPGPTPGFQSTGRYFDVAVSSGSTFQSATVQECGLSAGETVYWSSGGGNWVAVDPQSFDAATGCVTLGPLTAGTTPTLSELTGTEFGVGHQAVPLAAGDTLTFRPATLATSGALAAGQTVSAAVYAADASGSPVAGATVYLSQDAGAVGAASAEGTALSATPLAFTTGADGGVALQYTAAAVLPSGVTDTVTAGASASGSGATATDSYTYPVVPIAARSFTPSPVASSRTLAGGEAVDVTLLATDASGRPVVGSDVYLSFAQAPGGGSAVVGSTPPGRQPAGLPDRRAGSGGADLHGPRIPADQRQRCADGGQRRQCSAGRPGDERLPLGAPGRGRRAGRRDPAGRSGQRDGGRDSDGLRRGLRRRGRPGCGHRRRAGRRRGDAGCRLADHGCRRLLLDGVDGPGLAGCRGADRDRPGQRGERRHGGAGHGGRRLGGRHDQRGDPVPAAERQPRDRRRPGKRYPGYLRGRGRAER